VTEAKRAADLLNKLRCPFYIVPGNHDIRSSLWSVFKKHGCPNEGSDFLHYVIEDFNIRMIGLDTTHTNAPGGEICQRRAEWLTEKLKNNSEQPTIIFMHHPPVKLGVLETDEDGFVGANLLGDIVEKYSNILGILCGHIHLESHVNWRGTTISTAPSMGLQLGLDLTLTRPSEFFLEAPGYQLHYFTPDQNLVTHTIFVKKMNGPYLFEEQ
jgi:Icc-related predicted phosphoesterase